MDRWTGCKQMIRWARHSVHAVLACSPTQSTARPTNHPVYRSSYFPTFCRDLSARCGAACKCRCSNQFLNSPSFSHGSHGALMSLPVMPSLRDDNRNSTRPRTFSSCGGVVARLFGCLLKFLFARQPPRRAPKPARSCA